MSKNNPTWKPKQMVGTTLNIDAHELTLKDTDRCSVRSHTYWTGQELIIRICMHSDLLTFGCGLELWLRDCPPGNILQSLPHTDM